MGVLLSDVFAYVEIRYNISIYFIYVIAFMLVRVIFSIRHKYVPMGRLIFGKRVSVGLFGLWNLVKYLF
jgi:hypothetical protein